MKTHKTAVFAHKQLAAGAIGMTCAKVGEAEVLVAGGIRDILIANQIVGRRKIDRLVALARHADIKVAVDDARNVVELGRAAREAGVTLGILTRDRCRHDPVRRGARRPRGRSRPAGGRGGGPPLGVMGYEGHVVMLPDLEKRRIEARNDDAADWRRLCVAECPAALERAGNQLVDLLRDLLLDGRREVCVWRRPFRPLGLVDRPRVRDAAFILSDSSVRTRKRR